MTRPLVPVLCLLALAGCAADTGRVASDAEQVPGFSDWRTVITEPDRVRLRTWRDAWVSALAKADGAGDRAKVAKQGVLLEPDAALEDATPPEGDYRCRVTKLGAKTEGLLDYVAYPAFDCRITRVGDRLRFAKTSGSQRPVGYLYPSGPNRMVFLGTMMLGDEARAFEYGQDSERDMVGLVERIGTRRWRLVLPWPHWESTLDVIELAPA